MSELVDSHIHLSDQWYSDRIQTVCGMARYCGITLFANSVDLATSRRTLEFTRTCHARVIPFVGIHPAYSEGAEMENFEDLLRKHAGIIGGVGEIGMDRKYCTAEECYQKQREVFVKMLQLAENYGLPVNIHSRNSLVEVMEILPSYDVKHVLLHWFTGDPAQLAKVQERGYWISFGPSLVYSSRLGRLASNAERRHILVETDGPTKYGACFENREALPTFLPSVVYKLGSYLKITYLEAARITYENSISYIAGSIKNKSPTS